jgi:uncharacterized membrane protein
MWLPVTRAVARGTWASYTSSLRSWRTRLGNHGGSRAGRVLGQSRCTTRGGQFVPAARWTLPAGLVAVGLALCQSVGGPGGWRLSGAAAGATAGALTDIGIDDDLIRRIGEQLQPGRAAVFTLIRRSTPGKVTEAVKRYHPTVLYTNLTKDREEDLVKALQYHGEE